MDAARTKGPALSVAQQVMFEAPSVDGPLSAAAELAKIPDDATISGMFLMPMAEAAARLGKPLPSARERYTRFHFYPLREHVTLMFEAVKVLFPDCGARKGMRKLGRGAAPALLESTLGRVVLASAITPVDAIAAMAKAYEINLRPGSARILESGRGFAIVELKNVYYLLDCNHVGAMEGLLRPLNIRPEVRIRPITNGHAELLVCWPE